jgi:hypothetical protein
MAWDVGCRQKRQPPDMEKESVREPTRSNAPTYRLCIELTKSKQVTSSMLQNATSSISENYYYK